MQPHSKKWLCHFFDSLPPWDLSHGEQEAVELGLIDEIGGLSDALTCLHRKIERRNREEPAGLRDDPAL